MSAYLSAYVSNDSANADERMLYEPLRLDVFGSVSVCVYTSTSPTYVPRVSRDPTRVPRVMDDRGICGLHRHCFKWREALRKCTESLVPYYT
jgi:hypothetical protein